MTIKEIISALRRGMFSDTLLQLAADTIEKLESENNRQKAEFERLQNNYANMAKHCLILIQENTNNVIKEFAEKIKEIDGNEFIEEWYESADICYAFNNDEFKAFIDKLVEEEWVRIDER